MTTTTLPEVTLGPSLYGPPRYIIDGDPKSITDIRPTLITYRDVTGVTAATIAEATGASLSAVRKWYQDRSPSRNVAGKLVTELARLRKEWTKVAGAATGPTPTDKDFSPALPGVLADSVSPVKAPPQAKRGAVADTKAKAAPAKTNRRRTR